MGVTSTVSPALKALQYAEQKLGVNTVHEEAVVAHQALDKLLTDLSEAKDQKREKEARLEDKMMEIVADERSKHPEMSEAGMTRHLKLAYSDDEEVRAYRDQIQSLTNSIEGIEYDKSFMETSIKIAVARMHELGGYLVYLASIKNSIT